MKKLSKINLELKKEVITSLSGKEMNDAKGGTTGSDYTAFAATCYISWYGCVDTGSCMCGTIGCYETEQAGGCVNPSTTIPIETGSKCVSCGIQTVNNCGYTYICING